MREEFQLRARLLANFTGMVTRIEPTTGSTVGAPDVHIVNAAVDGFIEFKVVEAEGRYHIRPCQRIWHSKYCSIKGNSCFCILCPQGFWLIPSRLALISERVAGNPLNWEQLRPELLNFALRHAFSGRTFSRNSVERFIEPTIMSGVGHAKEKAIQRR